MRERVVRRIRSCRPSMKIVSPAVGILDNWEAIRGALIPILALTLLSTVLTFGIAGRATQAMMGKEEKPNDASGEH